jgi:indole-3-glycerol phosphate synthase
MQASLKTAITQAKAEGKNAVISEVKAASPSAGTIRENVDATAVAKTMALGGAAGISVLTEPKHFNGSLANFAAVRQAVALPLLMKDIIVNPLQLACASRMGANAVLLIQAIFDRGYCNESLDSMIADAHARRMEVLLETHTQDEFNRAITSSADLVGINNRNLATLTIDLNVTKKILKQKPAATDKLFVSESGIQTPHDIQQLKRAGPDAFLVGSSVMLSDNVQQKVKELVEA